MRSTTPEGLQYECAPSNKSWVLIHTLQDCITNTRPFDILTCGFFHGGIDNAQTRCNHEHLFRNVNKGNRNTAQLYWECCDRNGSLNMYWNEHS